MINVQVIGAKEVNANLRRKSGEINRAAYNGLAVIAAKILEDAKGIIKQNGSNATGQLRDSGIVQKQGDESIDVIFRANHAAFLEFGRKAGTPPPYAPIMEWIKKKGFADTYNEKGKQKSRGSSSSYTNIQTRKVTKKSDYYKKITGIAIAIAKKIGKEGTKAKPFLYPAFRQNEPAVIRELNEAIRKVL
jgi:HK97 gp10 family phage protein